MKTKIPIVAAGLLLLAAATAQATIRRDIYSDAVIQPGNEYDVVNLYEDATVGMTGGKVQYSLYTKDSSTLNLFDGEVSFLCVYDSSRLYMYGGQIRRSLALSGSGAASVFGGIIGPEIQIYDSGVLTVHGYAFEWQAFTSLGTEGFLSGNLLDGTPFRAHLRTLPEPFPGSYVVLVPEPGTLLIFSIGGLILLGRRQPC